MPWAASAAPVWAAAAQRGVLYDRSRVWAEQQQMVASGLLRPEIALAWYYDLPAETEADLQAVREKYMPAAKGGEKHE